MYLIGQKNGSVSKGAYSASLAIQVGFPEATKRWKEKTDSTKLSSDLHMHMQNVSKIFNTFWVC